MLTIFILSAQPGSELNTFFLPWFQQLFPAMEGFDWGHYAAYFVLALAFDFYFGSKADRITVKLLIVVLCTLYGITDEYHQLYVPGRTYDYNDLLHDAIGASAAMAFTTIPFIMKLWRRVAR